MPRLRHRAPRRYGRGFTLLELLVVLLIIGVTLTFVTLSVGDGGRAERAENEARRIVALIQLLGDEAILNSRQMGLLFTEREYRFLVLGAEGWQYVSDDNLLRPRTLPGDVGIALALEGLGVDLANEAPDEREAPVPQVVVGSSGERTPFELQVGLLDADYGGTRLQSEPRYLITAPPVGRITLAGPGAA